MNEKLRLYLDTSVFGGYFDTEFSVPTRRLFKDILHGKYKIVLSGVVVEELRLAPQNVQNLKKSIEEFIEYVDLSPKSIELHKMFMREKIVTAKSSNDVFMLQ